MKADLAVEKAKGLASCSAQRKYLGLGALILCGLAAWGFYQMIPELRRYLRIKRM
jgi:hypothetical protein